LRALNKTKRDSCKEARYCEKNKNAFSRTKELEKNIEKLRATHFPIKKKKLSKAYIEGNLGGGKRRNKGLKIRRREDKDHSLGHATKKAVNNGKQACFVLILIYNVIN